MSLAARISSRLAIALMTLFLLSAVIFAGAETLPGDAADAVLGMDATAQTLAATRARMGLDDPAPIRYWRWLAGIAVGDPGKSLVTEQRITREILPRLANTLLLALITAAIAFPTAVLLGIAAAIHRNSMFDRALNLVVLTLGSLPNFFVAYVLVLLMAVDHPWFPALSAVTPDMGLVDRLMAMGLPVATLALEVMTYVARMTRTAVISVLSAPYIEMATLRGVGRRRLVLAHALPNAAAPIVQVLGFNLAYIVVGVVIVETVFVYPGIGQYLVDAVANRDTTVVQASGLIFGAAYIGINALTDIACVLMTPRLRAER
jgi:peptide/nickel transport system permease protein